MLKNLVLCLPFWRRIIISFCNFDIIISDKFVSLFTEFDINSLYLLSSEFSWMETNRQQCVFYEKLLKMCCSKLFKSSQNTSFLHQI